MTIERTSGEIVFRLPSSTKLEYLQEIADLFTFQEISQKSKATQKEVDVLVKKIKKGRWAKNYTCVLTRKLTRHPPRKNESNKKSVASIKI